jgi:hypothetical protein
MYTDFLGRDPSGQVSGMHPALGVAIGAGTSTAIAEGLQWLAAGTKFADFSEALGTLGGIAVGGILYFTGNYGEGNKAAGLSAALAAVLTRGVSALIDLFMPTTQEAVAALAGAAIQQLSGVEVLNGMVETNTLSGGVQLLSASPMSPFGSVANHFGATPVS